jgi:hypothetical protein
MLGNRHIADLNQNIAEPHAAIITPASMNGLIITPYGSGDRLGLYSLCQLSLVVSVIEETHPMRQTVFLLVAIVVLGCVLAYTAPVSGQADGEAAPIYGIKIPAGYRDWRLISVKRLIGAEGKLKQLRAQLGNDIAMAAFREGKIPFPDGATIAALHWNEDSSDADNQVLAAGFPGFGLESTFAGSAVNVQFMVKDSKKYTASGGWGYADFTNGKPGDQALHEKCFPCHAPAKDHDYVFTQYAPTP